MIRERRILLLLLICFGCSKPGLKAQTEFQKVAAPVYATTSFFYDFPQSFGATIGVQFPLRYKQITQTLSNGKEKIKHRNLLVSSDVGFYRYAYNNTGLYFFQSIGKEYYKSKPYYFGWLASVGLLRTFYDGIVYSVDNTNNVHTLQDFGRYYATAGVSVIFGHNFERAAKPKPFSIAIKPSLWFQFPYNNITLPHLSLQATFNYHFHALHTSVKQKQVKRLKEE